MKKWKTLMTLLLSTLIFAPLFGCGADDDDIVARVVDLFLDDRRLSTGDSTVLRAQFVFSSDRVFGDNDDIFLVVQVPPELSFREGSAEVQGRFDEDVSPRITDCGPGQETYLRFRLDDEDLAIASNPSGSADAELALTLDAQIPGAVIVISAAADNDEIPFDCGEPFLFDRQVSMEIS
jgi:hypothetical protein